MGFALEPWRDEFPEWDMNYFWVEKIARVFWCGSCGHPGCRSMTGAWLRRWSN